MKLPTTEELIKRFDLTPHPEGGYFKETYRAAGQIPGNALKHGEARHFSTAIYFLLPSGTKSRFHKIGSDEVWHFYLGGPMEIHELQKSGRAKTTVLGPDIAAGEWLQHVVPGGTWFGGAPTTEQYSFVGCTVAPGFDFADFELGDPDELAKQFPQAKDLILRF